MDNNAITWSITDFGQRGAKIMASIVTSKSYSTGLFCFKWAFMESTCTRKTTGSHLTVPHSNKKANTKRGFDIN